MTTQKISWQSIKEAVPGQYVDDIPANYDTALAGAVFLLASLQEHPDDAAVSRLSGSQYSLNALYVPAILLRTRAKRSTRKTVWRLRATLPAEARALLQEKIRGHRIADAERRRTPAPASIRARVESESLAPNVAPSFCSSSKATLYPYTHAIGLEFECVGQISRRALIDKLPMWTRAASDGSIRTAPGQNGHEIRALLDRQTAEPRLHRLCKILSEAGLSVNRSTGLHVHLDARNIPNETEAVRVARLMDAWIFALRELVPASRRENSFCKFGISTRDRYRAVNVCAWHTHRTIEIRLHSGTIDYTKTLAWIRLMETIRAVARKPKAATSCLATLDQLPLTEYERAYWRGRHQQLNPSLYTTTTPTATTETE
jgi:hypothetical protein